MTQFDKDLIMKARSIRVSPQYIECNLLPLAQSEECRIELRKELDRAWRTRERAAFDTI